MSNRVIKASSNSLFYPSLYICDGTINRKKMHYKTRSKRFKPVKVTCTLIRTEESGNSPASKKTRSENSPKRQNPSKNSLLSRYNVVGVLGGVSVLSTLIFLEKLIWWSSKNGGKTFPFVVCNSPATGNKSTTVVESLRHKRRFLEETGVGCVVMPCHVSHAWYEEVSQGCSVDFPDVGDCVAAEIKEANFKPLEAGSSVKVGILASEELLTAGFYQEKLQKQGFEVVLPDKPTMDHMITPAIEAISKTDREGAQMLLRIAVQILLVKGVNAVVLACDEFQGLLPFNDPLQKRCIDPMDCLARTTIRWAHAAEKVHTY